MEWGIHSLLKLSKPVGLRVYIIFLDEELKVLKDTFEMRKTSF